MPTRIEHHDCMRRLVYQYYFLASRDRSRGFFFVKILKYFWRGGKILLLLQLHCVASCSRCRGSKRADLEILLVKYNDNSNY